jgi:hypothetical protein
MIALTMAMFAQTKSMDRCSTAAVAMWEKTDRTKKASMRAHTATVFNKMAAVVLTTATDARTTRLNSCTTLAVALRSGANPRQTASVGC